MRQKRISLSPAFACFSYQFSESLRITIFGVRNTLNVPMVLCAISLNARSLVFYQTLRSPKNEAANKLYCFLCKKKCQILIFQEGTPDSIKLLSDPNEEVIDKLAADLGLQRVGWIFTDLVADDVRKGTVKHLRDINTFFLTAEECILAGHLQNLYPSPCILSSSGKFGSKFTTVVVSGL